MESWESRSFHCSRGNLTLFLSQEQQLYAKEVIYAGRKWFFSYPQSSQFCADINLTRRFLSYCPELKNYLHLLGSISLSQVYILEGKEVKSYWDIFEIIKEKEGELYLRRDFQLAFD